VRLDELADSNIYIVDDEPANTRLLEAVLTRAGLRHLATFQDGAALLAAVEKAEPDLILLDLHMPGMTGADVLRALAARPGADSYLPVLVLTGDGSRDSRNQALSNGAHDFLTKPFDIGEVELRVRNLLQTRRLHTQLRSRNADLSGDLDLTTRRLAQCEREWAAQAQALSQLEARDTPEATAQAVCDAVAALPEVASAVLLAFDSRGGVVPIARNALADLRLPLNRALPVDVAERWWRRVWSGPWVGSWEPLLGSALQRLPTEEPTAMAAVPLRGGPTPLGALIVSTAVADGITYLATRLPVLESFAAVGGALLAPGLGARHEHRLIRDELQAVIAQRAFAPVFQPIVDLATAQTIGYEALTRFNDGTPPDRRFAEASAVGLGLELESVCLETALKAADRLPADHWLSLNVSPDLLLEHDRLSDRVRGATRPIVLEVTEHVAIEDYPQFRQSTARFGPDIRYAVDDAGAGFASFRHIIELRPDFVKLDIALVRDIGQDPIRQALVAGIVYFAEASGCQLIAEGIERSDELDRLRSLAVGLGQGYLLGRPADVSAMFVAA
jgi:EAL domain-containing protein (putative c-di-GMP-specific phosphodiesterase class I)/DNA-binding response OmpR family regulator